MLRSVPISFRATGEEAEFLAQLQVEGATTSSEKLRWLIQMVRLQEAAASDPVRQRELLEHILRPSLRRWREAEAATGKQSVLLRDFLDWTIEAAAFIAAERGGDEPDKEYLLAFEKGAAERIAGLEEAFLRLGITAQAPCHDVGAVRNRTGPLIELAHIMDSISKGDRK